MMNIFTNSLKLNSNGYKGFKGLLQKLPVVLVLMVSLLIGGKSWGQTYILNDNFGGGTFGSSQGTPSNSTWTPSSNWTCNAYAYQAGQEGSSYNVLKISSSSKSGSVSTIALDLSANSGSFIVSFDALQYSSSEKSISVTLDAGSPQTLSALTASWATYTLNFTGGTSSSIVKFSNSGRFFVANVRIYNSYTVTYNGNGNTGGSPPTDANSPYIKGTNVTVLGNTGSLVKSGYTFNGWNTAANGGGTAYAAAATLNSIAANTTLYAQWVASGPTVTIADDGTQVTTASAAQGAAALVLHKTQFTVSNSSAVFTGLSCTTAGTYASADLTNLRAWYQTSGQGGTFLGTGTATQVGATLSTPGTLGAKNFATGPWPTLATGTYYFFITADIAAGALLGNTISVSGITPTITSCTPTNNATAGGAQTFQGSYYWNGGTTTALNATWNSGTNWGTVNTGSPTTSWPATGTGTITANFNAAAAGCTVTIPGTIAVMPSQVNVGTSYYTFVTTGSTDGQMTAPITLANNVNLTLAPINAAKLVLGSVSGGTSSGLTLAGSTSASTDAIRVNLNTSAAIASSAPVTVSTSGTAGNGITGFVATGTGTSIAAAITNNSNLPLMLGATSGNDLTVSGNIAGSSTAGVQFSAGSSGGTGTVTISGTNTYSGPTIFNVGTTGILKLGSTSALPSGTTLAMASTSGQGGTLDLNGNSNTVANITYGAGTSTITNNGAANATLTISGSTDGSMTGNITDGSKKIALSKGGSSTLTLGGTNTYSNGLTVTGGYISGGSETNIFGNSLAISLNGGGIKPTSSINLNTASRVITLGASGGYFDATGYTLTHTNAMSGSGTFNAVGGTNKMGAANVIPSGSAVVINNTASNILDLNGYNQSVASIAGGGGTGGNITNNGSSDVVLTIGGSSIATSYDGVISDGSKKISLTMAATGTQTFSRTQTYTGTTTVSSGTINVTSVSGITSTAISASTQSITFASTTPTNGTYKIFPGALSVTAQSFSTNAAGTKYVTFNYSTSTITVADATITPTTITGLNLTNTTYGTYQTAQSQTINATGISGSITVTPPVGIQVSSNGSSFVSNPSTVSIAAAGTLYYRLDKAASAGNYNNKVINLSGNSGAVTATITTTTTGASYNQIAQAPLTITGLSNPADKTYDGTTTANIGGTAAYYGLVNSESFSVTGTPSASFADKNVGTGKTITITGYTAPSGNYSITQPGLTGNIVAKELTITGLTGVDKVYDGGTTASASGSATLNGVIAADVSNVTLGGAPTYTFGQSTVGNLITITTSGFSISGSASGNYSLTQPSLTANITKATPVINTPPTVTDITLGQALSASTINNDGSATPTGGSFSFTAPSTVPGSVGTYSAAITYTPTDLTNYNTASGNTNVTVNAASTPTLIAVSLSSSLTTTYGTASTGVSFTASGSNLTGNILVTAQTGFEVSTTVGSGYGSSVSVATGTTVYARFAATIAAGNYNSTTVAVMTATSATAVNVTTSASGNTVSQKGITISGLTAADKEYDGTTAVSVTGTPVYSGLVNGESFTVTGTVSWAFADINVGANKTLTQTGTYNTASSNYSITQPILTASISAASLTVTASAQSKNYGSTSPTAGTLNTNFTVSGLKNNDAASGATFGYSGSPAGNLATASVGSYSITPSSLTLSTGSTSNYTITYTPGTLTINAASLTITANDISKCFGNTYSFLGTEFTNSTLYNGDAISSVTLTSSGAASAAAVNTYSIIPSAAVFSTGSSSNYSITYTNGTFTVKTTPSAPTAGSTGSCTGTSLSLTASNIASATYAWTTNASAAFTSSSQNPTVSASATTAMSGTYSVTATVNGCTSAAGSTVVTINTTPSAPTAGSTGSCTGTSLSLTASNIASATYSWTTDASAAFTSSSQNPTVSASATTAMSGTYNVTATLNGCTSAVGSTVVTINTTPSAPTAGSTGSCTGSSLSLTASTIASATYSWTTNASAAFTSSSQNPTVSASATTAMSGTYSVTATLNGCTSTAGSTVVTIKPVYTSGAITTTGETICYNATPQATIGSSADASGGDGTITYQWQSATNNAFTQNLTTLSSSNTATYTPSSALTTTTYYRRQAHDGTCSTGFTSSSNYWTVTVNSAVSSYGTVSQIGSSSVNHLVISQVYGGGGNSGATYKNDFVELFNPTASGIAVTTGWSVKYASKGGTFSTAANLTGVTIPAGGYYLVSLFSQAAVGATLPTADASGTTNMSATDGSVELVNASSAVVDMVGFGAVTTSNYEGSLATGGSNTTSVIRNSGCIDTDNNNSDFTTTTPSAHNSVTTPTPCTSSSQTICSGAIPGSMSVSGAAGGVGTFTYQWFAYTGSTTAPTGASIPVGWVSLGSTDGANTATYTPTSGLAATTAYACYVTSTGCGAGNWASGYRQVTVNALPSQTITPATNTVCALSTGNTASVPASAGGSYSWTINNGTITGGGTTNSITYTAGSSSPLTLNCVITTSAGCASSGGQNQSISINAVPNQTITPSLSAVCSASIGNTASVPTSAGGTYSWSISNGTITGGNNTNSITYTAGSTDPLTLSCIITASAGNGGCSSAGGQNQSVTINTTPSLVTITPSSSTICNGGNVTLTASGGIAPLLSTILNEPFAATLPANWTTVIGSGDAIDMSNSNSAGGTAYEAKITGNSSKTASVTDILYYGPINTAGASTLTLTFNTFVNHFSSSYAYGVSVQTSTDYSTWHNTSWVTNTVTSSIGPALQTVTINTADVGSSTFYLAFKITGKTYGLNYWYIDDVNLTGAINSSVFTWTPPSSGLNTYSGASVTASPTTTQTYTATSIINGCSNSNSVTVTVNNPATITADPNSTSVCSATSTSFTASASGTSVTSKWQISINGGSSFTDLSDGGVYTNTGTGTLNISNVTGLNNYQYRLKATTGSPCSNTVYSNAATLTVNTAAAITADPSSVILCTSNGSASFTAGVSGTAITSKWQISINGGSSYTDLNDGGVYSNTSTNTLNISDATGLSGYKYRLKATTGSPCSNTVYSNAATLTVSIFTSITLTPTPGCTSGSIATNTSDNGSNFRYQLYDGSNGTFGSYQTGTGAAINWNGVTFGNGYYVIVTNTTSGCTYTTGTTNVTSNGVTALVLTGSTICAAPGGNGTISSTTSASGVTYVLYDGTNSLVGGSSKTGTGSALSWSGLAAGTNYHVVGSNGSGCSATSNYVAVATYPNPTLTSVAQTATVCSGNSATITLNGVLASTTQTVSYAINGTDQTPVSITSNSSGVATFTVPVTYTNNGQTIAVTTININATSCSTTFSSNNSTTLTVNPTSAVGSVSSDQTICSGSTPSSLTITSATGTIQWQQSSDAVFTTPSNIGTNSLTLNGTTIGALSATKYFRAVVTSGVCSAANSGTITIIVNQPSSTPTGATAGSASICKGASTTLTLNGGTAGTNSSIKWYTGSAGGTLVATGNGASVTPTTTTTYYGRYEDGTPCNVNTTAQTVTVTVGNKTWTGSYDTNWDDSRNWCGGKPSSGENVDIPTTSNAPHIPSGTPITLGDITGANTIYLNGNTLTINGTVSGSTTFSSTIASSLVLGTGASGTINFASTTDSVTNGLTNLTIDAGSGHTVTLGNTVHVYGLLSVNSGTFDANSKHLVLHSNVNGTASVGIVDTTGYGSLSNANNISVQRYHANKRAWMLMSTPLTMNGAAGACGNGSIKTNWQQQTYITAPPSIANSTNGLDAATNNTYGMLRWTGTSWGRVTNTINDTSLIGLTSGIAAANKPFFLFVRGDRSITPSTGGTNSTYVTLVSSGALQTGSKTFDISNIATSGYALVANPYAAPISLDQFLADNSGLVSGNTYLYYWDPNNSTTGGYTTAIYNSGFWSYSSKNPGNTRPHVIQSGEAFFVTKGSSNEVVFHETQKSTSDTSNTVFGNNTLSTIKVDMYKGTSYVDGILGMYNNNYSAAVIAPREDAYKFWGNEEGIAIARNATSLSVEARPEIAGADTMFLSMNKMIAGNTYSFDIAGTNMPTNITGTLVDKYLNKNTTLNLATSTKVTFTVDTAAAAKAANRFMVVFNAKAPLYVSDIKIKASVKAKAAVIDWTVSTEKDVKSYTVEHSISAADFKAINTSAAKNANNSNYSFTDNNAVSGNNYYRIKAINVDGSVQYSSIAKVTIGDRNEGISIYPNPIVGKTMNVQLSNIAEGTYSLSMTNANGQQVMEQQLQHAGGSVTSTVQLPAAIATGIYQLRLTSNGKSYVETVIVK